MLESHGLTTVPYMLLLNSRILRIAVYNMLSSSWYKHWWIVLHRLVWASLYSSLWRMEKYQNRKTLESNAKNLDFRPWQLLRVTCGAHLAKAPSRVILQEDSQGQTHHQCAQHGRCHRVSRKPVVYSIAFFRPNKIGNFEALPCHQHLTGDGTSEAPKTVDRGCTPSHYEPDHGTWGTPEILKIFCSRMCKSSRPPSFKTVFTTKWTNQASAGTKDLRPKCHNFMQQLNADPSPWG